MSDCTNKRIGALLYSYQMDLLTVEEADAFEVHLMECPACLEQFQKERKVSDLIRNDSSVRTMIESLDPDTAAEKTASGVKRSQGPPPRPGRSILFRTIAIAAGLTILLILRPWNLSFDSTDEAIASNLRLTVALFDNLVDPTDSSGTAAIISNLLVGDLAESHHLQIISSKHLQDHYSRGSTAGDGLKTSASDAARIAQMARAKWTLTGCVVQIEPKLILTSELIEVATGEIVSSHRIVAEEQDNIFTLVDKLAALAREDVLAPLELVEKYDQLVADVTTESPSAYRHYVEGLEQYSMHYLSEAERSWRKALEYDSTFAMVYYCLAYDFDHSLIEKAVQYSDRVSPKERLYIQSLQARLEGNYPEATRYLTDLVDVYPNEVIAWMELAGLALDQGEYDAGVRYLLKSIEVDPVYKDAYWLLALVYHSHGFSDLALRTADKYLALVPNEPSPYHTKGAILAGMGRLDDAVECFEAAVSRKPDFRQYGSLLVLGKLYIYQREYPKAIDCFQLIAVEGTPQRRSAARTYLGLVPLYQGQVERSLAVLNDGITVDRMELATAGLVSALSYKHGSRGLVLSELGDYAGARRELLETISVVRSAPSDDKTSWIPMYSYILAAGGNRRDADSVASELKLRLTEAGSDLDQYYLLMGMVETASANYSRAVDWLQRISDPRRTGFSGRFCLARSLLEIGRYDEAAVEFKALVSDIGDNDRLLFGIWSVKAYYFLARAYESTSRVQGAIEQYRAFLDIWKGADPFFQPLIIDARERLSRLENPL